MTTIIRTDLLALTPDTLAALANRGLVKRAAKELDAGTGPAVTTGPDGTVNGRFGDGTEAVLPPGTGLDTATCGCGAPGVCRHVVGLVLAYQRTAAEEEPRAAAEAEWSPGGIDDETLAMAVGTRALAAARRTFERGYTAQVHRPVPGRTEGPWVELPTCTVRFPVPGEVGYALTDAAEALRGEMVALAVWAFRAADAAGPDRIDVGGRTTVLRTDTAVALADDVLLGGVTHADAVLVNTLRRAGARLTAGSLHWPAAALADLTDQLAAHAARSAHYRPERVAELLAELHARHRAAGTDTAPDVLGVKEAGETPLRRVRLTALGCRIRGTAQEPFAEVHLAHADAGIVLVLRKAWTHDSPLTGHELASRRILGTTLAALSAGSLVSEDARRSASRTLSIARGRLAATSVTPVGSAWSRLPEPLLVRDLAAHTASWEGRPPRLIRPRVEAETVRAVTISEVESVGYDPAEQRLEAAVRDEAGTRAYVSAVYDPLCPGALDALAQALSGEVHCVTGALHRSGGRIVVDPIALLTPAGVTVPDLAPGEGTTALPGTLLTPSADPLAEALGEALSALADAAHHGLRHLTAPARERLRGAAGRLSRTGLDRAAALLRTFLDTLHGQGAEAAAGAWADAQIHLMVSAELQVSQAPDPSPAAGVPS
ncbi:hypothetical protein GCM10020367_56990 [Streptomyces sannanensis]|uniref:SWIM-type domain-containing protein n=1 Tax=Streptomyces sannanensis TaxID=285536 RepID=A0ABP6SJN1_9ACTN